MRLTIGRKLNGLIGLLLILAMGGAVLTATTLFTSDTSGLYQKGTLDSASMLAGRVRSQMKGVADRARILGAASFQKFRKKSAQRKFIQDNLKLDPGMVAMSLFVDRGKGFEASWRLVNPGYGNQLTQSSFAQIENKYPIELDRVGRGEVQFTTGKLKNGTPLVRMGIPFVQKAEGEFSQILVVELQQEKLSAVFAESTSYTSYLVDENGTVLASNDPASIEVGKQLIGIGIVDETRTSKKDSGVKVFKDPKGVECVGAYRSVGFAGLHSISHVPTAITHAAENKIFRRTGFLASAFLFFGLAIGVWFAANITRPIKSLAEAAEKVKIGDFDVRLDAKTKLDSEGNEIPTGDEIQRFSGTFNQMVEGLKEREHLQDTFNKFHSKEIAEKVLSGQLKLGGERREAIVFFSDVRDFTAMSEKLNPEQLVTILNRYMTRMVEVVFRHGGIVDKFVGDAIMAVWGVPEPKPDDARNSVMACLEMRKALNELNQEFVQEGLPELRIGMGLNQGPLIAGNIGSDERMEYTVIGDSVNTASRVESLTKTFGTDLLISQAVLNLIPHDFIVERTFEARVKGKEEPLIVYKVKGFMQNGQPVTVQTPYSDFEPVKSDKVLSSGGTAGEPPEFTGSMEISRPAIGTQPSVSVQAGAQTHDTLTTPDTPKTLETPDTIETPVTESPETFSPAASAESSVPAPEAVVEDPGPAPKITLQTAEEAKPLSEAIQPPIPQPSVLTVEQAPSSGPPVPPPFNGPPAPPQAPPKQKSVEEDTKTLEATQAIDKPEITLPNLENHPAENGPVDPSFELDPVTASMEIKRDPAIQTQPVSEEEIHEPTLTDMTSVESEEHEPTLTNTEVAEAELTPVPQSNIPLEEAEVTAPGTVETVAEAEDEALVDQVVTLTPPAEAGEGDGAFNLEDYVLEDDTDDDAA